MANTEVAAVLGIHGPGRHHTALDNRWFMPKTYSIEGHRSQNWNHTLLNKTVLFKKGKHILKDDLSCEK